MRTALVLLFALCYSATAYPIPSQGALEAIHLHAPQQAENTILAAEVVRRGGGGSKEEKTPPSSPGRSGRFSLQSITKIWPKSPQKSTPQKSAPPRPPRPSIDQSLLRPPKRPRRPNYNQSLLDLHQTSPPRTPRPPESPSLDSAKHQMSHSRPPPLHASIPPRPGPPPKIPLPPVPLSPPLPPSAQLLRPHQKNLKSTPDGKSHPGRLTPVPEKSEGDKH